tara:strand:+ start:111 stop:755 length:645 start_codon:yes stop_codon:yes gene_type:complete
LEETLLLHDHRAQNNANDSIFPLEALIQGFTQFKGIGYKTAQRLALEAVTLPLETVAKFSKTLVETKQNIRFCSDCYYLTWQDKCHVCLDASRTRDQLCVVSEPKDVLAIERTHSYKGLYHVLGGVISPLDGIYPEGLRFKELMQRVKQLNVTKIIMAVSPTVEGDTTTLYLKDMLSHTNISLYKLAQGIPIGSDLAYLDEVTIDKAFQGMMPL